MAHRLIDGLWWPELDRHARPSVIGTLPDAILPIEYCTQTRTCVQAGGNVGVWANYFATVFNRVVTIEPDEENFACLLRNVSEPRITPIKAALGKKRGRVGLHRVSDNAGAHFVGEGDDVDVITIDSLQLDDCDLIVLDIEGAEPLALVGAWETIARCRPILMVEDKGLSRRYDVDDGWAEIFPGYHSVKHRHCDFILVPNA